MSSGSSGSSFESVVASRQGVHSRTSRRRGQSWQQALVAVVSRQGVAVVVESRQGVVVAVVAVVAVVSGVSRSSCSKCCISF